MIFEFELTLVAGAIATLLGFLLAPMWLNRNDLPPGLSQNKCMKHITDPTNDPRKIHRPNESIKIIRLTNSGEFVERCELTNALYELNWDRTIPSGSFGANKNPEAKKLPKLAVLYIHGWKHDASQDDSDLKSFSRLICELRKRHEGKKYVVGIYVGWNAISGLPSVLENVSFWVKKSNADRIAQSAVVTKIISAIGSIIDSDPDRRDQFVAIGHSFGARILFSAVAQSLVYETERAHPSFPGGEYRVVEGAASAIILLNAAFEASRYSAIDDISRKDERFKETQPPLVISVSTDNDWATSRAFPIGQWLGSRRSERELTTLGNYEPFFTHALVPARAKNVGTAPALTEEFYAAGLEMTRLPRNVTPRVVHAHNPFLVARTTSAVIDGHNGIWAESFMTWLSEFITAIEVRNDDKYASFAGSD
jgi:hypothetical protein